MKQFKQSQKYKGVKQTWVKKNFVRTESIFKSNNCHINSRFTSSYLINSLIKCKSGLIYPTRLYSTKITKIKINSIINDNKIKLPFLSQLRPLNPGEELIFNLFLKMENQNKLNIPIHLTDQAVSSINLLIDMLNSLHSLTNSKKINFHEDSHIFNFLSSSLNSELFFNYYIQNDLTKINFLKEIPLKNKKNLKQEINNSSNYAEAGVYCFKHLKSNNSMIGSTGYIKNRLNEHILTLQGHKVSSFFHR